MIELDASLAVVGLGRMGLPLAITLCDSFEVMGYDRKPPEHCGTVSVHSELSLLLDTMDGAGKAFKIFWLMVPMGSTVDDVIRELLPRLSKGDVIIDGGNADYRDSQRRRARLHKLGIGFVAAGTSGGLQGAASGPPMAVDADPGVFAKVKAVFTALGGNYCLFSKPGQGHLAKTLHNAIEYGMMQSLAEGVALYMKHGFSQAEIRDIFRVWSKGSIIESRLVTCVLAVLEKTSLNHRFEISKSETADIVRGVLRSDTKSPIIEKSVEIRQSPDATELQDPLASHVLAALRNEFGGHAYKSNL